MKRIEEFIESKGTIVLFGIIAFGAFLRLYHINYQSLWLDELYSIVPTAPENSVQSIIDYCKEDQPPFFFIYLHLMFKFFGYNEQVGRVACAFIGILGIPVVYFLAKECSNKTAGIFAAVLVAINYFHIHYSQDIRFYSMTFLFTALSYLFFIRAYKTSRPTDFIVYSIFTVCLLYSHYYGMIIFGTQAVTFLIILYYQRDLKFILRSIASAIVIMLAFLPWTPIVMNDLSVNVGWIKDPSPYFFAEYFYYYTGKDAFTASVFCVLIFLFFKIFFTYNDSNLETKPIFLIIIIWIFLSYLIPYIRSVFAAPMLADRYTIVTLPAWIILFALGWNAIHRLNIKYLIVPLLVLSAIINLLFFRQYYTRIRNDQWREASNLVLSRNKLHHPIYSTSAWHFSYYFRDNPVQVRDLNSSDLSKVDKFWFLIAHASDEEIESQILKLQEMHVIVERHVFFGANAVLLTRK